MTTQLGRAEEGREALRAVWAIEPALQRLEVVEEVGNRWFMGEHVHARYREGYLKALAFV